MAMVRVWNITDDTNPDVKPHNRMVLGKVVKPGRAVQVDEARLARAHKVHKDVAAGFLFIGPKPPASYQAVKTPPRATADARRVDENGQAKGKLMPPTHAHPPPPKKEAPVEAADEVKVTDEVKVELKEAVAEPEAMPEEAPEDEETDSGGKRRRRK